MAIEKHDTTENTLVPVSEKYTLTIKKQHRILISGQRKCVDWQKITEEDLRYSVETGI